MTDVFVDQDIQPEGPVDDGQVEELDGAEATETFDVLDFDQYGNFRVPVKVEGQEDFVPLTEAVAGYQRQADYTRKTQELSAQRNDLGWAAAIKAALEQDPQGTLQLLSTHYGVAPQPVQQQVAQEPNDPFDDWTNTDDGWGRTAAPTSDPRLDAIAERLQRIEQAEADMKLRQEVAQLQTEFPDFNPQEVVTYAIRMNTSDLRAAFKQMSFDKVYAEKRDLEEKVRQATAQRTNKQQAAIVSGGSAVQGGGDQVGEVHSFADAFNAAKRQLGM